MPPNLIKLYYFGIRARGEAIRHLLLLANAPFEDIIIDKETWPSLKKGMKRNKHKIL